MNYLKQNHLSILIIVFLVASSFLGGAPKFGALDRTTVGNPWTFSGAVTMASTLALTGAATLNGVVTTNAGVNRSYTSATSTTATSETIIAADMLNFDTVLMTPNTASLTVTFPATSTLSTFVPTAGDMAEQCWYNATTTSGILITFAAGTGFDFRTASSSATLGGANLLSVPAGSGMCFKFIREAATASKFDILTLINRYAL